MYVDNTIALGPDLPAVADFLAILNGMHPTVQFAMETAVNNRLGGL